MEMFPSGIFWCAEQNSVIIFPIERVLHRKIYLVSTSLCAPWLFFCQFLSEIIRIHCRDLLVNYFRIIRLISTLFHEKCTFSCVKYQSDNVSHQKNNWDIYSYPFKFCYFFSCIKYQMCPTKKYHWDIYSHSLRRVPEGRNCFHEKICDW